MKKFNCPDATFHRPAAIGPAVTIHLPSGLNAAVDTGPKCPRRTRTRRPVRVSQMRASLSRLVVTAYLPSRDNATSVTGSRWPRRTVPPFSRTVAPSTVLSGFALDRLESQRLDVARGPDAVARSLCRSLDSSGRSETHRIDRRRESGEPLELWLEPSVERQERPVSSLGHDAPGALDVDSHHGSSMTDERTERASRRDFPESRRSVEARRPEDAAVVGEVDVRDVVRVSSIVAVRAPVAVIEQTDAAVDAACRDQRSVRTERRSEHRARNDRPGSAESARPDVPDLRDHQSSGAHEVAPRRVQIDGGDEGSVVEPSGAAGIADEDGVPVGTRRDAHSDARAFDDSEPLRDGSFTYGERSAVRRTSSTASVGSVRAASRLSRRLSAGSVASDADASATSARASAEPACSRASDRWASAYTATPPTRTSATTAPTRPKRARRCRRRSRSRAVAAS